MSIGSSLGQARNSDLDLGSGLVGMTEGYQLHLGTGLSHRLIKTQLRGCGCPPNLADLSLKSHVGAGLWLGGRMNPLQTLAQGHFLTFITKIVHFLNRS